MTHVDNSKTSSAVIDAGTKYFLIVLGLDVFGDNVYCENNKLQDDELEVFLDFKNRYSSNLKASELADILQEILNENSTLRFEVKCDLAAYNIFEKVARNWGYEYFDSEYLDNIPSSCLSYPDSFEYLYRNPNLNGATLKEAMNHIRAVDLQNFISNLPKHVWTMESVLAVLEWAQETDTTLKGSRFTELLEVYPLEHGRKLLGIDEDMPLSWVKKLLPVGQ